MTTPTRRVMAALATALVVTMVLIVAGAVAPPRETLLMVHADDAGFSAGVNGATIRGMERGVITSASIMVMLPGFDEIADYAIAHPEMDFGVHLVLTSEKREFRWGPVLAGKVPSLVKPDGTFWSTSEEVAEHAAPEEVERELRAQIRKALDRGVPVSHLDHHMWVLLQRPEFLRIYARLGTDFGLPVRLHRDFTPEECGERLHDAEEYVELIEPLAARGNPLFDLIETKNYDVPADKKRDYYLGVLRSLQPGLTEFVIHCASNRVETPLPGMVDRREADARVFTSPEFREEIRRLGIRLVNWKSISRTKKMTPL